MSYFSNLALEYEDIYENYSYPSPEEQLLWRLHDLYDVIDELKKGNAPYKNAYLLSDNDVRYAIPEYFGCILDVERAINLAISDLCVNYGIKVKEEPTDEKQSAYDTSLIIGQRYFNEIELVASYDKPLNAA